MNVIGSNKEEALFAAALGLPTGADRAAYLVQACGSDHALRQRIELLLVADQRTDDLLGRGPAGEATTCDDAVPLQADHLFADRFKLRQKLGEGGMGEVWVADQIEPVQRRVALKVIRPGMATPALVARFEQERQALALMDHPNIAKVFDAGTTGHALGDLPVVNHGSRDGANPLTAGQPYFVMELVKGAPITQHCDDAKLSLRARLELLIPICHAVQHAHQKGIIHRDLKPSNLLVAPYDGKVVPKVIDFGVAKAVGKPIIDQTIYTEVGSLVGTLEYLSPEQAELNNLDIDTRSDVYSLGVVLYELLTGSVPISRRHLPNASLVDVLRHIREVDPPKPSTKVSDAGTAPQVSAARRVEPRALVTQLRGELDWIVMKCLEKDRARRYQTAAGLAKDLQRYLDNEPVEASPPSASYRLRKFVRRHRGPVAAAGAMLALLIVGVVGTTLGFLGERRAKETAEKRLLQVEKGIDVLSSVFENLDPNAEVKEGRPLRAILGDRLDHAATALAGESVGDQLLVAKLQDRLARTYLGLGHAAKAEALFAKAVATRTAELGAEHVLTLETMHQQALACREAGQRGQAIVLLERIRDAHVRQFGNEHPITTDTCYSLAWSYSLARRKQEAITLFEQIRDVRSKQFGPDHPLVTEVLNDLGGAYLGVGRGAEAVTLLTRVRDERLQRLGSDHLETLEARNNLAFAYQATGKMRLARELLEQTRDELEAKLGDDHPQMLMTLNTLASVYRAFGQTAEAIKLAERVRAKRTMLLGVSHPATLVTLDNLALAYRAEGQLEKALPLFQQAAVGMVKLNFDHEDAPRIVRNFCSCLEQLNNYAEADVWRRKWLAAVKEKDGLESAAYASALSHFALSLGQRGKPAEAEALWRECLAILDSLHPDSWQTYLTEAELGASLLAQRKYAEAERGLVRGVEGMLARRQQVAEKASSPALRLGFKRLIQLCDDSNKPIQAEQWLLRLEEFLAEPAPGVAGPRALPGG